MASDRTPMHQIKRTKESLAVVAFVVFSVAAPFLLGEMYPVTVSPMFCDKPTQCCTYRIVGHDGHEVDPELFGLHLVYDGNPVGLGMGIKPTPTLHDFGEVPGISEVEDHVREIVDQKGIECGESIKVTQTVYRCDTGRPLAQCKETTIHFRESVNP